MVILSGKELRAECDRLGVSFIILAPICGTRFELLQEFGAGRYVPSEALQRELLLALQSVETIRQIMPGLDPFKQGNELRQTVLRLYDGYYAGYRRDPDERAIARKQIAEAGEATT